MRSIALYASATLLLLAACGQETPDGAADRAAPVANQPRSSEGAADEALQPVDNQARPAASGEGGEAEMAWTFTSTGEGPKIAYGEPQTDNVRLMLRCPDSGEALLSFIRPAEEVEDRPDTLVIASAGSSRSLTIEMNQGQLGTSVEAQAPLKSGALQQFHSGNELELRWGEETFRVPGAVDGPVRQFFETCGA